MKERSPVKAFVLYDNLSPETRRIESGDAFVQILSNRVESAIFDPVAGIQQRLPRFDEIAQALQIPRGTSGILTFPDGSELLLKHLREGKDYHMVKIFFGGKISVDVNGGEHVRMDDCHTFGLRGREGRLNLRNLHVSLSYYYNLD